ncbi:hypothetical protein CYMTET_7245 [Cymbomonas tetramitiformis]|uniref:Uncharacterized protein n=1 Tax=Cymbomonas tetramitiformis TaxID=36881 RepID=A0AAE0GVI8_9CHLO|nr:hypothetical protein CYMTET_7245 [Cymbomonas tetramitiformis]
MLKQKKAMDIYGGKHHTEIYLMIQMQFNTSSCFRILLGIPHSHLLPNPAISTEEICRHHQSSEANSTIDVLGDSLGAHLWSPNHRQTTHLRPAPSTCE